MVYSDLCSFYFSVFDEHPIEMTLEEFVGYIRSERWKAQTEEYQLLMASGQVAEARKFKRSLAAMVIAGRCKGKTWSSGVGIPCSMWTTPMAVYRHSGGY